MTVEALLKAPLHSVDRGPRGMVLAVTEGRIDTARLNVTVTEFELHFAWADRNGPAFSIPLNALVKEAFNEIETLLGIQKGIL